MTHADHHRLLERLYRGARCNAYFQPEVRIGDGEAEIAFPIRDDFHHAANAVHGSVYFKALDDAAFFAANSRVPGVWVLTSSFHVHLLAPIVRGRMRAVGKLVHEGKRQLVAEATAYDGDGRVIARGSGTFSVSRIALVEPADSPAGSPSAAVGNGPTRTA